jgi:recombination protein RecT
MNKEAVKGNIQDTLGKKTAQFVASVASLVNSNSALAECEQRSILSACLIAATLDLPINQNLGFAYIIPYNSKNGPKVAQFQMGYKGFIQLAMRSGQFKTINVTDVREGELKGNNRLTGEMTFDWLEKEREKAPVIGYVAYMELVNGFRKQLYMSAEDLKKHGMRFSQSMKRGYGLWKDDFDSMAVKTVIKLLLSKYAPMTVDMQKAQLADQAISIGDEGYQYPDNQPVDAKDVANDKERERILAHIKDAKTVEELEQCREAAEDFPDASVLNVFGQRFDELNNPPAKEKK